MSVAGARFGQAQVAAIFCVHGTFTGTDILGLLTELARFAPSLSHKLSLVGKRTIDLLVREIGNYTPQFIAAMQQTLSAGAGRTIPVQQFLWAGQNNHISRADGAVRLIANLADFAKTLPKQQLHATTPPRVLLWGHSHGGNVFALLSNLLGSDRKTRENFFETARPFYQPWLRKQTDMPVWHRVQKLLEDDQHPLRRLALDIATFGTPIRYGWDTQGYDQLLHFVHHRPVEGLAKHLAGNPLRWSRFLRASDGDCVHQIGIAGSNFIPIPLAVRTLSADWQLKRFLEANVENRWLHKRLRHAMRVPDEGTTLLVDYDNERGNSGWNVCSHIAGHAVYTRSRWLPWHCEQVAEQFYSNVPEPADD